MRIPFCATLLLPIAAAAADPTLGSTTGLLTVPSAAVQSDGTAAFGVSRYNPKPDQPDSPDTYALLLGFVPGLELAGRVVDGRLDGQGIRDLSFNAKYRLWGEEGGPGVAVGVQDVGGAASHFRTKYAVASLPWQTLDFSLGYGLGPDVLKGVFGGMEWRPCSFLGLIGEYDTRNFNGGLRLVSPSFFGGIRLSALSAYRSATKDVEFGAQLSFPLGRKNASSSPPASMAPTAAELPAVPEPSSAPPIAAIPPIPAENPALRTALTDLGFESVSIGVRDPDVQVVVLENRRYNHSSADGIGLALGIIASRTDPGIRQIELTTTTYGVSQMTVRVPVSDYRKFLDDPAATEVAQSLHAKQSNGVDETGVRWDSVPTPPLNAMELVVSPVLRTFVATEFGVLDYGLGVRGRFTLPLATGVLAHLSVRAPLVESNDFRAGQNFSSFAPQSGIDEILLQYLHKPTPQWTWLWSAGRTQVYNQVNTLEQAWVSDDGAHRLHAKAMYLRDSDFSHQVALAGYTWFDASRDYSLDLTGGRFFAGDNGFRISLNRYFGDTILTVFFKAADRYNQAGGIQISLPLTPRQDAYPRGLQVKGSRRWSHSLSTTLNAADHTNSLRPFLLYEPSLDLDLERDILDSGRLGEDYLREELPRMREAYRLWAK